MARSTLRCFVLSLVRCLNPGTTPIQDQEHTCVVNEWTRIGSPAARIGRTCSAAGWSSANAGSAGWLPTVSFCLFCYRTSLLLASCAASPQTDLAAASSVVMVCHTVLCVRERERVAVSDMPSCPGIGCLRLGSLDLSFLSTN
jgi:hypothetical protein